MKKTIVSLLVGLSFILVAVGPSLAASNVQVNVNVTEAVPVELTLATSTETMNFDVKKGEESNIQELTTTVTGAGNYTLNITGADLTSPQGSTIAASHVSMKKKEATSWSTLQNGGPTIMVSEATATEIGDQKTFQFKINGQGLENSPNIQAGSYSGTQTISVIAQ